MPSCGLSAKYTFFFFNDINRWDEWDGKIIDNWWRPDDIRPSRGYSSDSLAGLFVFQNDRIVIKFDGSASVDGIFSIPTPIIELTTTQWDDFGVQIFQYAGDVTLIGMPDTLSQMPELQDDDFARRVFFCEEATIGREMLYIYHHELPESKLWNLLMDL